MWDIMSILVCLLSASAGAFLPPPSGQHLLAELGPARGPGIAPLAGPRQTRMSAPPLRNGPTRRPKTDKNVCLTQTRISAPPERECRPLARPIADAQVTG